MSDAFDFDFLQIPNQEQRQRRRTGVSDPHGATIFTNVERKPERATRHRAGQFALRYPSARTFSLAADANPGHRRGGHRGHSRSWSHAAFRRTGHASLPAVPRPGGAGGFRLLASLHYFRHLVLAQSGRGGDEHHQLRRPVDPARNRALWLQHRPGQFHPRRACADWQ